jgi:hypothetical protein
MPFPVEDVPDADRLFLRVHWRHVKDGMPEPSAFDNHETGMSTDWAKYATSAETLARAHRPARRGVVSLVVGDVRTVPGQTVIHEPTDDNRAHTEVFGEKTPEVRMKLRRLVRWEIQVPPPPDAQPGAETR